MRKTTKQPRPDQQCPTAWISADIAVIKNTANILNPTP